MSSRENLEEFLRDLSLTVPTFLDYEMIDWMILALWACAVLWPTKNRPHALILMCIVECLWGMYDLSNAEYAQAVVFFCHALVMMFAYLKHPIRSTL